MLKFVFFLLIGFNIFLFNFTNTKSKVSPINKVVSLSIIDEEVLEFIHKWNIPGASIAIVKNERLVYAKAFGEADDNVSTKTSHQFRIASLSKPVTSVAIMKLIEEKKLNLEDLVFGNKGILNYPEFTQIADNRIYAIKVKHLLEHSAGWDRETSSCGDPMFDPINIAYCMGIPSPADPNSIIKYMLSKQLDFSPGTKYSYSNFGYAVLGRIIEKVTGYPYEEYLKKQILAPLGITGMKIGHSLWDKKEQNEVKYFEFPMENKVTSVFEASQKVNKPYGGFNLEAMDAHGGWIASAPDLAKLLVSIDGFPIQKDILKASTINQMTKATGPNPYYAYGWCVNPKGNWWHTGSLYGSASMIARLENGISWVLLFNGNPMTSSFYKDMDRLIWNALDKVERWPQYDLFLKFYPKNSL